MSRSVTATWGFFHTCRDEDSTMSLGRMESILSVKNFFLILSLSFPWYNLKPFHLILSFTAWEKRLTFLATTVFQVILEKPVIESEKVSLCPLFSGWTCSSLKHGVSQETVISFYWITTLLDSSMLRKQSHHKTALLEKLQADLGCKPAQGKCALLGGYSHAAASRQVWWALRVK